MSMNQPNYIYHNTRNIYYPPVLLNGLGQFPMNYSNPSSCYPMPFNGYPPVTIQNVSQRLPSAQTQIKAKQSLPRLPMQQMQPTQQMHMQGNVPMPKLDNKGSSTQKIPQKVDQAYHQFNYFYYLPNVLPDANIWWSQIRSIITNG